MKFTEQEKQFLLGVITQLNLNPASPDALEMVAMVQGLLPKLKPASQSELIDEIIDVSKEIMGASDELISAAKGDSKELRPKIPRRTGL